jgi:hypothetical protein
VAVEVPVADTVAQQIPQSLAMLTARHFLDQQVKISQAMVVVLEVVAVDSLAVVVVLILVVMLDLILVVMDLI